jgi:hypothetical protein
VPPPDTADFAPKILNRARQSRSVSGVPTKVFAVPRLVYAARRSKQDAQTFRPSEAKKGTECRASPSP